MNERIKRVRKELGLTQREFAERIGMKQNSIAIIESGRNTSDQTIFAICREFNVNEEWLRNGTGKMFKESPVSLLDELAEEYHLNAASRVMIEKFITLRPEEQNVVFAYMRKVVDAMSADLSEEESLPESDDRELTIDEKVELYRRELEREEKVGEEYGA